MPELASPWWLLGLALVPLVRWLHLFRSGEHLLRVPAVFLWRRAGVAPIPGRHRSDPAPIWRRRALAIALIVLGLAGPSWNRQAAMQIEVWIDDRPSLFSREAGGITRLDLAARALSEAVAKTDARDLVLHTLTQPRKTLSVTKLDPRSLAGTLRNWLPEPGTGPRPRSLPQPATGIRRWLLSDGTGNPDPAAFPFYRALAVGRSAENQAVIRLALRPSLREPRRLTGLVSLINAGKEPAPRTLELALDARVLETREPTLNPGQGAHLGFQLPVGATGTLTASLRPDSDALPADDSLALNLDANALGVSLLVEGDCGPAVTAAVDAHPGLRSGDQDTALLRLRCSAEPPDTGEMPTLWLAQGPRMETPAAAPVWTDYRLSEPPMLRSGWIQPLAPTGELQGRPLLVAGNLALILERERRIDVLFELDNRDLAARPELPRLMALLLDRLAGHELLYAPITATRDPSLASIAPHPLPHYSAERGAASEPISAAPLLLAAALALVLVDLLAGRRYLVHG